MDIYMYLLNCDHLDIGTIVPNMTVVGLTTCMSRSNPPIEAKSYLIANCVKGL